MIELFIRNSVGTTLLTIALALSGAIAFRMLPVSPLPQVDFPTIQVQTSLPGASPETMASSVATPLERQFGRIASLTEMTSSSSLGATNVVLQFDLNRNIDAAARDVQAAINAARSQLPSNLPSNPTYRKVNPADSPIVILALASATQSPGQMYDAASSILSQKLSQIEGVGQVVVGGSALPGVRVELNPTQLDSYGIGLEDVRTMLAAANANRPKGEIGGGNDSMALNTSDQLLKADQYRPLIVTYRNGAAVGLSDVGRVVDSVEDVRNAGLVERPAGGADHRVPPARRQYHRDRRPHPRRVAAVAGVDFTRDSSFGGARSDHHHSRVGPRRRIDSHALGRAGGDGGVSVPA